MLVQHPQRHHRFGDRHFASFVPQLDSLSLDSPTPKSSTSISSSLDSPDYNHLYFDQHYPSQRSSPPSSAEPLTPYMSDYPTNPPIHIRSSTPAGSSTNHQVSMNEEEPRYYPSWSAQHLSIQRPQQPQQLQHPRLAPAFLGHKRLSSDSSVATSGLDSPYSQPSAYPYIVDSDNYSLSSPHLESYDAVPTYFPKASNTSQPTFSDSFLNPAFEGYNPTVGDANAFMATQTATRQGMRGQSSNTLNYGAQSSSQGYYAPTCTRADNRNTPKFERTITDVYQDELYLPSSQQHRYPQQPSLLSPTSPSALLSNRLQEAQQKRSTSPPQNISREKSPFRTGSILAAQAYQGAVSKPESPAKTEAQMRAERKAHADALALAQHTPHDSNDAGFATPRTISPKEALIEDPDDGDVGQLPLFPSSQSQSHYSQQQHHPQHPQQQHHLAMSQHQQQSQQQGSMASRRRPHQQDSSAHTAVPPPYPFLNRRTSTQRSNTSNEQLEFPTTLSSMESTRSETSDSVPPQRVIAPQIPQQPSSSDFDSSQRSLPSPLRRPENTSANTGSYTCTSANCSARFENSSLLQKHRRESHPEQPSATRTPVSATFPNSPQTPQSTTSRPSPPNNSTASSTTALPPPSNSNSNSNNPALGPHKCTRLNPTTGKPCNTIFSRSYDLTRHEDTIHDRRKQKVRCGFCTEEKTFSRNDALTRHMRVVHPEVEFPGGVPGGRGRRGGGGRSG